MLAAGDNCLVLAAAAATLITLEPPAVDQTMLMSPLQELSPIAPRCR